MTLFEWLVYWLQWVLEQLPIIGGRITTVIEDLLDFIWSTGGKFVTWWNNMVTHVAILVGLVHTRITNVKDGIYGYLTIMWNTLVGIIDTAVHNYSLVVDGLIGVLRQIVWGWIEDVYTYIVIQIGGLITIVKGLIAIAVHQVKQWARGLLEPINMTILYLFNGVTILIDRPIFFFSEILGRFFLRYILEEIGHAIGAKNRTLPPKTDWWNF